MLVNKVGYKPINVNDYNPDTLYGQSKTQTETITKTFNLDWVIVRPTSIWGPWFSEPYLNFFNFIQKNLYFSIPSNESSIKTYGYVENTCYQINEILFSNISNVKNSILYLGDYEPLNISDWADLISLELHEKKIIKISKKIFYLICIFGEILKYFGLKNFPLGLFRYKNMTTNNIIDLTKTMEIAKDLPYPEIEIQVKKTLKWLIFNNRHN
jgi:nucleoside-diphosphate-sugar epimerase